MLREIISNEWFTALIVLGLIAITMSKQLFPVRFNDFISVLGNSKYLKIYSRDQKFIDGFDTLVFFNLIISLSIFGFLCYSTIVEHITFDIISFSKILFGVAALVLIKVLFERLIGSLFDIDKLIDQYLFQKTSYLNFSGLILLPMNIILLYAMTPSRLVLLTGLGLFVLINFVGLVISFKNHQKLILNNLFYFILYLCALEIGPYLILYKVIAKI